MLLLLKYNDNNNSDDFDENMVNGYTLWDQVELQVPLKMVSVYLLYYTAR